jgi:hypothetical protein
MEKLDSRLINSKLCYKFIPELKVYCSDLNKIIIIIIIIIVFRFFLVNN